LDPVRLSDAGNYSVIVTNSAGKVTTTATALIVTPVTRISNLSIRSSIGAESGPLTVGITIGGNPGTKPLLLRAVGPTLAIFGVSNALSDPKVALLSGANIIGQNDDWGGDAQVSSTSAAVGAFLLASEASKDSASVQSVGPGSYTVRITGAGSSGGVVLAEIYDTTPSAIFFTTTPRLVNVSALTQVGTSGDILIAGFSITGSQPKTLLVRGIGPTLGAFGVPGVLLDPKLELYAAGATLAMVANDDWGAVSNASQLAAVATSVGAFALPSGSKDAALLVTLPPGSYTAQVSGVNNTTGLALIEVYEVP
jgi:hypothetical protein